MTTSIQENYSLETWTNNFPKSLFAERYKELKDSNEPSSLVLRVGGISGGSLIMISFIVTGIIALLIVKNHSIFVPLAQFLHMDASLVGGLLPVVAGGASALVIGGTYLGYEIFKARPARR